MASLWLCLYSTANSAKANWIWKFQQCEWYTVQQLHGVAMRQSNLSFYNTKKKKSMQKTQFYFSIAISKQEANAGWVTRFLKTETLEPVGDCGDRLVQTSPNEKLGDPERPRIWHKLPKVNRESVMEWTGLRLNHLLPLPPQPTKPISHFPVWDMCLQSHSLLTLWVDS